MPRSTARGGVAYLIHQHPERRGRPLGGRACLNRWQIANWLPILMHDRLRVCWRDRIWPACLLLNVCPLFRMATRHHMQLTQHLWAAQRLTCVLLPVLLAAWQPRRPKVALLA